MSIVISAFSVFSSAKADWEIVDSTMIETDGDYYVYDDVLLDVFMLPEDTNFAWTCGHGGKIYRTTDGGRTWRGSRIPSKNQLEHIQFVNKDVGYVSGNFYGYSYNEELPDSVQGSIYKSTDGGATWRSVTPRYTHPEDSTKFIYESSIWGHSFVDEMNGIALKSGCGMQRFFRTTNGGETWDYTEYNIEGTSLSDVILLEAGGLGYASSSGMIWMTLDGGTNWEVITDMPEEYQTTITTFEYDTVIVDGKEQIKVRRLSIDTTLIVRGWQEEITFYDGSFLVPYSYGCSGSTDLQYGGAKFVYNDGKDFNITNFNKPFFGSFLINDSTGWAVGHDESVYYTNDRGLTWELRNCGVTHGKSLDDLWFANDSTGLMVGDVIYRYVKEKDYEVPTIQADGFTACFGDSIYLELDSDFDFIRWYDQEGDVIGDTKGIYVNQSGIYMAFVRNNVVCDEGRYSTDVKVDIFPEREFFISNTPDKQVFCEGEKVTLWVNEGFKNYNWSSGERTASIDIFGSGLFTVSAEDENGCLYSDTILINYANNPKPEIEIIGDKYICENETVRLIAPEGYSIYNWFWRDGGTNELISNERIIEVGESGIYYVAVETVEGCQNSSDEVEIEAVSDDIDFAFSHDSETFVIDTTVYPHLNCREMEISNNTPNKRLVIKEAFLKKNIEFSVSHSSFPLILAPGESGTFTVCFSPLDTSIRRDTMLLDDACSRHTVPLSAVGIFPPEDTTSIRCDIPVVVNFESIGAANTIYISKPYPNPSASVVSLDYSFSGDRESTFPIDMQLYDYLGNNLITKNVTIWQPGTGTFTIDLANIENGLYYLNVSTHVEITVFPIVVTK